MRSVTDIQSCFSCVLEHLSEEGYFVVDIFNPSLSLLMREAGLQYPVTEYVRSDGKAVIMTETNAYDPATQINHILWHYQCEGEPMDIRSLEMRIFFPQELDALLSLSGFTIVAKYGDFLKSEFSSGSRHQIIVCRKASPVQPSMMIQI